MAYLLLVQLKQSNCGKSTTGKSFSEPLILASTNPQYDKRLFIELPVQYMKTTSSEHQENMLKHKLLIVFVLKFRTIYVHKFST